jgi:hypothetical protein
MNRPMVLIKYNFKIKATIIGLFMLVMHFHCTIGELPNVDLAPPLNVLIDRFYIDPETEDRFINITFHSYNGGSEEVEQEYFSGYNIYLYPKLLTEMVLDMQDVIYLSSDHSVEIVPPDDTYYPRAYRIVDPVFQVYQKRVQFTKEAWNSGNMGTVDNNMTLPINLPKADTTNYVDNKIFTRGIHQQEYFIVENITEDQDITIDTRKISEFIVSSNRLPSIIGRSLSGVSSQIDLREYAIEESDFPKSLLDAISDMENNPDTNYTLSIALSSYAKTEDVESALSDVNQKIIEWIE